MLFDKCYICHNGGDTTLQLTACAIWNPACRCDGIRGNRKPEGSDVERKAATRTRTLTRDADPRFTLGAGTQARPSAAVWPRSHGASVTHSTLKRVAPRPVTIRAEMSTNSRHVQEHRGPRSRAPPDRNSGKCWQRRVSLPRGRYRRGHGTGAGPACPSS